MLKPISDHIIIETIKEEKKKGSIILPDTVEKEKSEQGKIVAVGPGKIGADGKRIPMEIKKGDVVVFSKYGPHQVKVGDREYMIARQEDIFAIIS